MAVFAGSSTSPAAEAEPAATMAALTAAAVEAGRRVGPRGQIDAAAVRRDAGRELRRRAPRGSHAHWEAPPDRPDPVDLLSASNDGRVPEVAAIRIGRMAASPSAFLSGSAGQIAFDLQDSPMTGLTSWICGDAQLSNFGVCSSPEGELVCDISDFDESIVGPWEWDVKRLAASIVLAGRERGFRDADCRDAVETAVGSYRRRLGEMAARPLIDAHSARWQDGDVVGAALRHGSVPPRPTVRRENGGWHFDESPPLLVRLGDEHTEKVLGGLDRYVSTLRSDLRRLVRGYALRDVALEVLGVGTAGTRNVLGLMVGNGDSDVLFLQITEARASQLRPYLASQPRRHEGRRVVDAQHAMQALPDPFLGWTAIDGREYYVRQLKDIKRSAAVGELQRLRDLRDYGHLAGGTLGMAHARCFDATTLTAYLGSGARFAAAMAEFGVRYADQTERDHSELVRAIKRGRVEAELGI